MDTMAGYIYDTGCGKWLGADDKWYSTREHATLIPLWALETTIAACGLEWMLATLQFHFVGTK